MNCFNTQLPISYCRRALFINLIVTHSPDIIIGSESWLKPPTKDHEYFQQVTLFTTVTVLMAMVVYL